VQCTIVVKMVLNVQLCFAVILFLFGAVNIYQVLWYH